MRLKNGFRLVCELSKKMMPFLEQARVEWPSEDQMATLNALVLQKYPLLPGSWGFIDGLCTPIHPEFDPYLCSPYYNGWTHDHYVKALIVFAADGTIAHVAYNNPGSWHDAKVYANSKLREMVDAMPVHLNIVADSAFPQGNGLLRSSKENEIGGNPAVEAQITSLRQSVEWGMGSLQKAFPRLVSRLFLQTHRQRQRLFWVIFSLFNFRVRTMGRDQTHTVFVESQSLHSLVGMMQEVGGHDAARTESIRKNKRMIQAQLRNHKYLLLREA